MPMPQRPISKEKIERFSFKEPNSGCWLWEGKLNGWGYGIICGLGGERRTAHRATWEVYFGPVPAGMLVCHHCDTPSCVRPDHLFLGTDNDNAADRHKKGRSRGPRGSKNAHSKITQEAAIKIYADRRQLREIAKEYGISLTNVSMIRRGKVWRWATVGTA